MTPMARAFTLKASDKLDYALMSTIFKSGYSRIPVFADVGKDEVGAGQVRDNGGTVVGLLFTKDLILVAPNVSAAV